MIFSLDRLQVARGLGRLVAVATLTTLALGCTDGEDASQVARAVRATEENELLGELLPERLRAVGESQSAFNVS